MIILNKNANNYYYLKTWSNFSLRNHSAQLQRNVKLNNYFNLNKIIDILNKKIGGPESLDAAFAALSTAKNPVLLCGGGVVLSEGVV